MVLKNYLVLNVKSILFVGTIKDSIDTENIHDHSGSVSVFTLAKEEKYYS